MSERDVLDDAFAALRDETADSGENASSAAATRRAVVLAATTRRRRSLLVRLVLPIAAVLAASTAWAAATGRLSRVFHAESEPAPAAQPVAAASTVSPPSLAPSEPTPAITAVIAPTASGPASAAPEPRASGSVHVIDPEETLYRAAHEAHFVSRDPARALTAWDTYLAAHPNGRFAPEARYNRALTLVRLGRTDEARAATRSSRSYEAAGNRSSSIRRISWRTPRKDSGARRSRRSSTGPTK